MKEALRCVLTFDTAHTLTSQSLSIVGSFIEKLKTSYLSHQLYQIMHCTNLSSSALPILHCNHFD